MPRPANLQRRPNRPVYYPVTVNFALRRKSSVKALLDKTPPQNSNRWRQDAV